MKTVNFMISFLSIIILIGTGIGLFLSLCDEKESAPKSNNMIHNKEYIILR